MKDFYIFVVPMRAISAVSRQPSWEYEVLTSNRPLVVRVNRTYQAGFETSTAAYPHSRNAADPLSV